MGLKSKKRNKKRQADESASENNTSDIGHEQAEEEYVEQNDDVQYENTTSAQKRKGSDSDDEDDGSHKKIKKKKKKTPVAPDSTEKKGKKSIRQMKKEKHALRQAETEAAAKDQLKAQCVTYLSQWKHDRQNWKFMKAKQVWLYKNKFSVNLVPESSWQTFLEYFESAKGNIRNMLIEDANKIIKQMDEWTEAQEKENEEDTSLLKPDDAVYNRARSLIQCLGE